MNKYYHNNNILSISNIYFNYNRCFVIKNLCLQLQELEFATLIGASGSGKTTLFKLLTGLIDFHQGSIRILGGHPKERQQKISYMMQQDMLLPWRTVLDNVLIVNEIGTDRAPAKAIQKEALELLEDVGLSHYVERYPEELSTGMRQRVSLARALLQKRPLLLLDEPFGALDVGYREQMYQLVKRLKEKYRMTVLMITHDFRDALSLSDRLFMLREGQIYKEWQIEDNQRQDLQAMALLQQELHQLLCR